MSQTLAQTISLGIDVISSDPSGSRLTLFSGDIAAQVQNALNQNTVSIAASDSYPIGSVAQLLIILTNGSSTLTFTSGTDTATVTLTNNIFIIGGALSACSLTNTGTSNLLAKIIAVS